jgi:hypothetical protein
VATIQYLAPLHLLAAVAAELTLRDKLLVLMVALAAGAVAILVALAIRRL